MGGEEHGGTGRRKEKSEGRTGEREEGEREEGGRKNVGKGGGQKGRRGEERRWVREGGVLFRGFLDKENLLASKLRQIMGSIRRCFLHFLLI